MLSCISFHYYSIASDELAVISTSGCYCFLWNKHLLISTGQAIYGKAYQKLSAKIQKIKHISTVDVLGIGQANFSLSHPLYNLYYFLLIFSSFSYASQYSKVIKYRDGFSTYMTIQHIFLEENS